LRVLVDLEYIIICGGNPQRGYQYSIQYWDDFNKNQQQIKQDLISQL